MKRFLKRCIWGFVLLFLLPAGVSLLVWQANENRPGSWNSADWSSAGLLPPAAETQDAVVYVMAARTGRWKGALSVHSWLVVKQEGEDRYTRYEVVGWGNPMRINAYAADARWYSNEPEIIHEARGAEASSLILSFERAIYAYQYAERGDYVIWPGPNSNSFIAHLLDQVPESGWVLPANAVGRDWLGRDEWIRIDPDRMNLQVSLNGYAGVALGARHGFEINLLGLVFGFDVNRPALKLPGFGNLGL